eukprot:3972788-Pleurochrysis_carterae.AAC.1
MTGSIVPNAQLRVVNPHVLAVEALSVRGHFATQCASMTACFTCHDTMRSAGVVQSSDNGPESESAAVQASPLLV